MGAKERGLRKAQGREPAELRGGWWAKVQWPQCYFRLSDYCFGVKDQGGWGKVQRSPGKRFELWSQKSEERGSLEAARVWLINSIMQRIIGTLKFQGLVLGAKFVLTAPCPVEEARVRGRLFLAKQSKLHSKQKYFRLSATNRSPGKLFTALWNEEVSKERYSTTYFLIFQRLHGLTSAVCQIAGHLEACCACKGHMENWVLVFCAPLPHHRMFSSRAVCVQLHVTNACQQLGKAPATPLTGLYAIGGEQPACSCWSCHH